MKIFDRSLSVIVNFFIFVEDQKNESQPPLLNLDVRFIFALRVFLPDLTYIQDHNSPEQSSLKFNTLH
jgi:hypothetical protein